jgi:hypothetical protein
MNDLKPTTSSRLILMAHRDITPPRWFQHKPLITLGIPAAQRIAPGGLERIRPCFRRVT